MNQIDVIAVGRAAGELRTCVRAVLEIANALGLEPRAHINGIAHYDRADVNRIAARLRELDQLSSPT